MIAVMGAGRRGKHYLKKEIDSSEKSHRNRKQKIAEYTEEFANPYQAAKGGYVDDVIFPRETRQRVARRWICLRQKEKPALPRSTATSRYKGVERCKRSILWCLQSWEWEPYL
jgi:acetyl-CoA carboxylase carboxyltransferase component